jgi:hypothetical protein
VVLLVQLSKVVLCFERREESCIRKTAGAGGVEWVERAVRSEFGEVEVASENRINIIGRGSKRSNF